MTEYLFAGKSNSSRSPMHAAVSHASPRGGLRYRSLCGSWITTNGMAFRPEAPGSCAACSRALKRREATDATS